MIIQQNRFENTAKSPSLVRPRRPLPPPPPPLGHRDVQGSLLRRALLQIRKETYAALEYLDSPSNQNRVRDSVWIALPHFWKTRQFRKIQSIQGGLFVTFGSSRIMFGNIMAILGCPCHVREVPGNVRQTRAAEHVVIERRRV